MKNEALAKVIDNLKTQYNDAVLDFENLDTKSWGYQQGVLISANDAKIIFDAWEGKPDADTEANDNKPPVMFSVCDCSKFPRPLIIKYGEIFCTKCNAFISQNET